MGFIAVYKSLLARDMMIFKRKFISKLIDTFIMLFTNLIVFAYIMPQMGMSKSYGPFLLIGTIAIFGFFDVIGKVIELIGDIEGDRRIYYTMTLPLSSTMVFIYIGLYWAINTFLVAILMFPLGKLILLKGFDLSIINYPKLILIFIASNLFYGYFSLWLTSVIKGGLDTTTMIWVRVVVPLFMFGGYYYSWAAAYSMSSIVGYISLGNPLIYITEGMRAATLGQEGFLPFWTCLFAVLGFTFFCMVHGIYRLRKKLDCI